MKLVPYRNEHYDVCIALFDSNRPKYLAESERQGYEDFLNHQARNTDYFVVESESGILAAGGFAQNTDNTVQLTWGLVDNDHHGNGIGSFLTEQRLSKIHAKYPQRPISLDTSQHTIGFYKNHGFRPMSWEFDAYGPGIDKIQMLHTPHLPNLDFDTDLLVYGPNVHLSPLTEEDFDSLFAVAKDPAIWAQHPAKDRYKPDVFRSFFDTGVSSGMAYQIKSNEEGKVLGSSRYHQPDFANSSVEIGWTFLGVEYWGGKVNAELKNIMLRHAFRYFQRVHFCIGADNLRSRKAVEKLGAYLLEGKTEPGRSGSVFYEITEGTYLNQP